MANDELQTLLRTGIQAAQSGNKAIARRIFEQVLDEDPNNELAWIWLASVTDDIAERQTFLEKALAINPDNPRAKQALEKLKRAKPKTPPVRATPRPAADTPAADFDREALLSAPRRRRRSPLPFILVGMLAIAMIAAGLFLLWGELQTEEDNPTPSPTGAPIPAIITSVAGASTATPTPRPLPTLPPEETLPPTWTPTATWTPLPSPTPTVTPPPLTTYTLLVSGKRDGQPEWALYTLLADGTNEQRIPIQLAATTGDTELQLLGIYDAVFSPDGQQIAFTARQSSSRIEAGGTVTVEFEEIFLAPAEGGTAQPLTDLEATNTKDATWSPDGQQIAFASDADGDYDVYIIGIDGSAPRQLTLNKAEDRNPAWSPDGQYIAFASDEGSPGFLEVWRVAPTGADLKQLTDDVNNSFAPAWSPDSQWIAFLSNRRGETDLFVMDADGYGERALLVRDIPSEDRDPAWSPDGRWIAYSSNRETGLYEIFLIRPDGTGLQEVTSGGDETRYVDWRPLPR